uniref:proton-translocating NAD(P)(+) transhydrogenase n=1 Tax=Macrostomum lignano TaxID=282301 RepID=A0A1I8FJ33_9PLAT
LSALLRHRLPAKLHLAAAARARLLARWRWQLQQPRNAHTNGEESVGKPKEPQTILGDTLKSASAYGAGLGTPCCADHILAVDHRWLPHCLGASPPALHSPLMSVTNAVSGITAVGGLLLMGGGLTRHRMCRSRSAHINIGGGFLVTQRMLDMFKRPTDPPEFNYLYLVPGATLVGGYGALLYQGGGHDLHQLAYLGSSLCWALGALTGLSSQKDLPPGQRTRHDRRVWRSDGHPWHPLQPEPSVLAQMGAVCLTGASIGGVMAKADGGDGPAADGGPVPQPGGAPPLSSPAWPPTFNEQPHFAAGDTAAANLLKTVAFLGTYIGGVTLYRLPGGIRQAARSAEVRAADAARSQRPECLHVRRQPGFWRRSGGPARDELRGLAALAATTGLSSVMGVTLTAAIGEGRHNLIDF